MKNLPIILLFIFKFSLSGAQLPSTTLSLELGGNGLLYGVHLEKRVVGNLFFKVGTSYFQIREKQTLKKQHTFTFPMSIQFQNSISPSGHSIEYGFGIMNLFTVGNLVEYNQTAHWYLNPTLHIGYRFQPPNSPISYRLAANPFIGTKSITHPGFTGFRPFGAPIQLWGSLGIGYTIP